MFVVCTQQLRGLGLVLPGFGERPANKAQFYLFQELTEVEVAAEGSSKQVVCQDKEMFDGFSYIDVSDPITFAQIIA